MNQISVPHAFKVCLVVSGMLPLFSANHDALSQEVSTGSQSKAISTSQDQAKSQAPDSLAPTSSLPRKKWALILVGLPGDEEHHELFQEAAAAWKSWLIESLEFPKEQVLLLSASSSEMNGAKVRSTLTSDSLKLTLENLRNQIQPDDTFWFMSLGHGNYDGKRAWFHISGKDPSDEDLGRWLSELRCREQVIWLTHSASGWYLKALSRPGRIVMTATAAEDEFNQTEFPHALTQVTRYSTTQLDANRDKKISIAEIFRMITSEVQKRFDADKRLPTEHALLDDNGDGIGTEVIQVNAPASETAAVSPVESTEPEKESTNPGKSPKSIQDKSDGDLARNTFLSIKKNPSEKPSSSENSTAPSEVPDR